MSTFHNTLSIVDKTFSSFIDMLSQPDRSRNIWNYGFRRRRYRWGVIYPSQIVNKGQLSQQPSRFSLRAIRASVKLKGLKIAISFEREKGLSKKGAHLELPETQLNQ